jgi:ribonuclease G
LLPKGFGIIVRTVAEGKNAKALDTDLRLLVEKWRRIEKRMVEVKEPPAVLHQDVNMVSSVIRDLFSEDYERILIDDQRVYRNVKGYVQAVAPHMAPAVRIHKGREPVFRATKIERSVRQAFEPRVDLPSGGYLIIEHTEAMHVIDVNSGRAGRGMTQEQNSLKVNLESARMVAQQLRLRDLGGIIVVDFIDLKDERNRKKVFDELKNQFRKDRAVTKVLPMSDFGLVQITRQRLRPSVTTQKSTEPSTLPKQALEEKEHRVRTVLEPAELTEKIENWIARYHEKGKRDPLILRVHAFTSSYLNRGFFKASMRWRLKHGVRVTIEEKEDLDPMVFRFYDAKTGEELTRRQRSGRRRGGKRRGRGRGTETNDPTRSEKRPERKPEEKPKE